ncbi:MAG TPA: type III-A CRISPR-associated protein Csm2 [Bryobacteraceae bacterium]|nr:type III-A CRISPR-associated protein Csm2 [Bryobacteraceae bacterium]HPQ15615.1 type III-A CRISPR-associated protein Csm2 [Bryobacteraceae bacterium]HPU74472.1 type III-A CRISPR-associated protein Csm2 [Bryobacteraceae bacterium]
MATQTFRRGGPPPRREDDTNKLPQAQPVKYFDADGRLRPALVDEEAEAWAKKFTEIKASQLRRFYETVLNLKRRLELAAESGLNRDAAFERLRAEFKMLRAKAVYTRGRAASREKNAFTNLLQFFTNHTAAVQNARDFAAFYQHFQAVMAFHKFYAPKEG